LIFSLSDPVSSKYGLTIGVLNSVFGEGDAVQWSVHGIPEVGFYRMLHHFLKKWTVTHTSTKTSIGKFYLAIDKQLQERRSNPWNTYRFIEQLVSSNIPDSALMFYGLDKQLGNLQAEVQGCHDMVQELNIKVQEQQAEICQLKSEFESTKGDLMHTKDALKDMTAVSHSTPMHCRLTRKCCALIGLLWLTEQRGCGLCPFFFSILAVPLCASLPAKGVCCARLPWSPVAEAPWPVFSL